jgi:hypothetical protein
VRRYRSEPSRYQTALVVSHDKAREILSGRIWMGEDLLDETSSRTLTFRYETWRKYTTETLGRIFTTDELATQFSHLSRGVASSGEDLRAEIRRDLDHLESIHQKVEIYRVSMPDALETMVTICQRFHLVARQLSDRYGGRETLTIRDEWDALDLLHALLRLFFDDIRPEEWTPSYAGGPSKIDFLLKNEKIVIETKMTRQGRGARDIGGELLIDIGRYAAHPDCHTLICFVYDPDGHIGNPSGLENDLTRVHGDLHVKCIVAPKGH